MTVSGNLTFLQLDGTLIRPFESSDQSKQSCLAATGWTQQSQKLSMGDVQVNSFERPLIIFWTVTMPNRPQ